jgi:hypothetical protein
LRAGLCLALLAIVLAGCGPKGLYHWGSYSSALNSHYRDPAKQAAYREALQEVIAAEQGARVPPGIYAELGYLELASGNTAEAKRLFQQEKARWPESGLFMDRMIRKIDQPDAPATTPAVSPPATAPASS